MMKRWCSYFLVGLLLTEMSTGFLLNHVSRCHSNAGYCASNSMPSSLLVGGIERSLYGQSTTKSASCFMTTLKIANNNEIENEYTPPPLVMHHSATKVRNITLAIEFYGLLGFQVSTKFRAGPARAAWLELGARNSNTNTGQDNDASTQSGGGCRLELIEVPSFVLDEPEGMRRRAYDLMDRQDLLGHNHLALDVTHQIAAAASCDDDNNSSAVVDLTTWLQALNQTSIRTSNRMLRVALEPQQQMIGQGVYELAFLYDADGALIELLNKQSELSQPMASGWEPWDGSDFQQRPQQQSLLPTIWVLLPVYNAMPWLPLAVSSTLRQEGVAINLIAVDDGCTDGGAEWLVECAALLRASQNNFTNSASSQQQQQQQLSQQESTQPPQQQEQRQQQRQLLNPALQMPARSLSKTNAAALHIDGSTAGDAAAVTLALSQAKPAATNKNEEVVAMSPSEVVEACQSYHLQCTLTVLHSGGRGQGAALEMAFEHAVATAEAQTTSYSSNSKTKRKSNSMFIGEVEADDESAPNRFRRLWQALKDHPEWDGAGSMTELLLPPPLSESENGTNHQHQGRPGMARYVHWQNQLKTPEQMRLGRFIEIPALRQTVLFRREALSKMRTGNGIIPASSRRDDDDGDRMQCQTQNPIYRELVDWPVDSDFWYRWYDLGLVAGKIGPPALYFWRQHAGQSTRTHGRCSLENLRKCKIHFLVQPQGLLSNVRQIEIWSRGATLDDWVKDVQEAVINANSQQSKQPVRVLVIGEDGGDIGGVDNKDNPSFDDVVTVRRVDWKPGMPIPSHWKEPRADERREGDRVVVRLFAFGMPKARDKVRTAIRDWDPSLDWFVA